MHRPLSVLLIEDDPVDAQEIERMLSEASTRLVEVEHAGRSSSGVELLSRGGIDLVMLTLRDRSSLDAFSELRARAPDVPIIVVTAFGDDAAASAAVEAGAQDHLVKGSFDGELLARAIAHAVERHDMHEQLRRLATVDELTGLYNRRGFLPLAEHQLRLSDRSKGPLLLLFIDLDRLGRLNEIHGHEAGSRMLQDTAAVLTWTLRTSDVLARVGGDDFCVLLTGDDAQNAERVLIRLVEAVATHNARESRPYELSLSVGAAPYDPENPCSIEELMERADALMREEKQRRHKEHELG
jgi:two-component system cell cycle response regulator